LHTTSGIAKGAGIETRPPTVWTCSWKWISRLRKLLF